MPASQFFEFEFLFDDDSEAKGKNGDLDFDWNAEDGRLSHRLECDYTNKDPVREKLSAPAINTSTEGGQRAHLPLPQQYDFALVADLDKGSRDPKKFEWHSIMQKATLRRNERGNFTIEWGETIKLTSTVANKNRSMELSELVRMSHSGSLLGMCDSTGIVYEISPKKGGGAFPRHAIADGNGRHPKPFKTEWATEKDGLLYLGSIGKEWVVNGEALHHNCVWVKTLDRCGKITSHDWTANYKALRVATNTTFPGYLSHEAVAWHPEERKWLFLPRKASEHTPYDERTDEFLASNLLLIADEDFSHVEVRRVGPLECDYGFTSMKVIPHTNEIIALKVREVNEVSETWITIFDLEGNFRLEPRWKLLVDRRIKYEGLAFL
ncbi:Ca2+dependent endoplasmic reticulum nucleoside diphosphatase isoform 3, putative [Acanthamoeba castellanii str. Neff]|uniref:Ca2+dependent endoplasmic reticulum nucleoside diphosphatase isoform 3, putative n=1 Tax=Acanthamoeba castellanii (strain ATCC 30010 / Neff) TaxID=1257118 RepID=L8H7Y3_ACACF|nr:Ca2+dependent endoplasmic reticulum nucleoside diphosphatase isoform 3, putative [Acanthamoeba castellanii str. Neff]ELR20848.1 Ca2+dependent endoplasmic reticulum nucleoside diphosphatase isoform 3, putative [Acanthamoeba castellanii str. Neff]